MTALTPSPQITAAGSAHSASKVETRQTAPETRRPYRRPASVAPRGYHGERPTETAHAPSTPDPLLCFCRRRRGLRRRIGRTGRLARRRERLCLLPHPPRAASLLASDVTALRTVPTRVSRARRSSTTPYAGWDAAWITYDARWTTASAIAPIRR